MSEDKNTPDEAGSADEALAADLDAYFFEYNAQCEICRNRNWYTIRGDDDARAVSLVIRPADPKVKGYSLVVYSYVCVVCGNTKFLNKYLAKVGILEMKEANSKGED